MAVGERWMSSLWPFVREHLPPAPARVLELGCGEHGGFVPRLRDLGYEAVGVDPHAPAGPEFRQTGIEQVEPAEPVDAVIASRSLHHVADLGVALARVAAVLRPGGTLIVIEWAWERFDEPSARWCIARLTGDDDEPDWIERRRDGWAASGEPWDAYFRAWAEGHGIHRGERVLAEVETRFARDRCDHGPYFFAELGVPEAGEQAAIDAGEVQATGIRYVGTLRAGTA
jgi:SAM-dependent methyltransferase